MDSDPLEGPILRLENEMDVDQDMDLDVNVLVNGEYYTLPDKTESNIMTLVLNSEQMASGETNVSDIACSASQFIEKAISQESKVSGIPPDIVIRVDPLPDHTIDNTTSSSIDNNMVSKFLTNANNNSPEIIKSTPSSPLLAGDSLLLEKKGVQKRQRSYSDSGEQLSAQDRALIEEIERGSQFTLEDQELFEDLSKSSDSIGGTSASCSVNHHIKNDLFISSIHQPAFIANNPRLNRIDMTAKRTLSCSNNNPNSLSTFTNQNLLFNTDDMLTLNNNAAGLIFAGDLNSATRNNTSNINNLSSTTRINVPGGVSGAQVIQSLNLNGIKLVNTTEGSCKVGSGDGISAFHKDNIQKITIESETGHKGMKTDCSTEVGGGGDILNVLGNSVPSAAAQTIKQVVVHINGKEQVFDVPQQINGSQLTVHPLTVYTVDGPGTQHDDENPLQSYTDDNNTEVELFANDLSQHFLQKNTAETNDWEYVMIMGDNEDMDKKITLDSYIARSTDAEKSYMCVKCGAKYQKPSKLKLHVMSKHIGHKPYKCTIPNCDWAFTQKFKLVRHMACHQNKQEGFKEFKCEFEGCNKRFTTIYNLNAHVKLHARPLCEQCRECDERFSTKKDLYKHMKANHGEESKTVKCPYEGCGMMFFSEISMGSHLQVHKRSNYHPCTYEGCDKVFTQPCKLKNHLRLHTNEKPYVCPFPGCNWKFNNTSHLKRHTKTHTNERNFECDECGKKFLRPEHLKGHMISHTGERPFVCDIPGCNAKFTAKSTMYIHKKKHRVAKTYNLQVCPIEGCGSSFITKFEFRKHIDEHYSVQAKNATAGDTRLDCPITACPVTLQSKASFRKHIESHHLVEVASTSLLNHDAGLSTTLPPTDSTPTIDQHLNLTAPVKSYPKRTVIMKNTSISQKQQKPPNLQLLRKKVQNQLPVPKLENDGKTCAVEKSSTLESALQFINLNIPIDKVNGMNQLIVTPELAQSLLAASVGSMIETGATSAELAKKPITIPNCSEVSTPEDVDSGVSDEEDESLSPDCGGSARTDYHSNNLLSIIAKRRRHILKQKAAKAGFDLIAGQDIAATTDVQQPAAANTAFTLESSTSSSLPAAATETEIAADLLFAAQDAEYYQENEQLMNSADTSALMNPNEVVTSRAITIRDPETGATYVQTQLLQDDPPNYEFDAQGNLNCIGNSAEVTSLPPLETPINSTILDKSNSYTMEIENYR